ncbi:type IV pilus twitching motility protein PilT [Deinococcus radiodurans]|jgi:pilus retraction protein PilT|uniref:Twitching motility protein n=1 Tax=Deinococcus radiodurans (strain ATCC 13939 / DSM 20539 / JCM 16871 / CCUG 27074 / LMG 4051 / NBRC 15346 / NCIMB 9279 / VKM B-1422 / R1) TaxID=243230 RepID=Q9RX73_DEIRA|nr:type IV pilus twitching motility protein PilT [Deinococcus radiodurans]AAF10020.1 twitching motility protein [Deinococcus radiodurans R1 = ATCC 13939 = DSM 20539]ANC72308.1 type IV pili twitching motility protein PilT [Deinococcus radiodurans R1 = ATCC 13939 = DSM 20539]QEM72394.1 type IV pilus twitching motility protein PilT [Deinococcus radiodurans]QIP28623.1 type IV pilus twitching motility protein PilT [Deinococcus radiodurans]QIP32668.1 type IV pilus twitching motility protein PilT [De
MSVLNQLLAALVKEGASDIHLRAGTAPAARINGVIRRFGESRLSPQHLQQFTQEMLPSTALWESFNARREADFAYGLAGVGRFRVNAYFQRGSIGLIMRVIEDKPIPTFEELGLPTAVFNELAEQERGLVLVTGPTGSGKTTTLASLIDYINSHQPVNIVTLEDPIEVLHRDKMAMVNQRELGLDTLSFSNGLRAAMRQDPDIILIGEMRDKETVEAALSAAQTGHLVLSTLHTQDAIRSVNRIIDFFAPHERTQIRQGLSESMVGIVSQRLLPRSGGGRVMGMEVMLGTPTVRECIKDPERTEEIKQALMEGGMRGMRTFDQHLVQLVLDGQMTQEDAMSAATSPHELKLMLMKSQYA